jgi:hypothetical protein
VKISALKADGNSKEMFHSLILNEKETCTDISSDVKPFMLCFVRLMFVENVLG